MASNSPMRQNSNSWRAIGLSVVVGLAASSGGLGAQERSWRYSAVAPEDEVVLMPAPGEISVRTGNSPHGTLVGIGAPLVRYRPKEVSEQAEPGTNFAGADIQSAKIEKAAGEKQTALAAWNAGLHDELAQREAQPACDTPVWAFRARLVEEARVVEASARALRQFALLKDKLEEQGRQIETLQSLADDLAQRLSVAEAQLKRRGSEDKLLTAELAAFRSDISSGVVLDTLPGPPAQHAKLPPISARVAATIPHPKPRMRASDFKHRALASGASAPKAAALGDARSEIDGAEWAQVSGRQTSLTGWKPAADAIDAANVISAVALAPSPTLFGLLEPGEESLTSLDEAAARIADGLRAAREDAIVQQQEQVFVLDVDKRAFATLATGSVPLDPAIDIRLLTAKSEVITEHTGGIRFFPDGSSTGGRIELEFLGNQTAVSVRWSTGAVMLEQ